MSAYRDKLETKEILDRTGNRMSPRDGLYLGRRQGKPLPTDKIKDISTNLYSQKLSSIDLSGRVGGRV
jgi:hypothetical protein